MHFLQTKQPFLLLILGIFAAKAFLLVVIFPLFQNPDEQTHYSTIQTASQEEKVSTPPIAKLDIDENDIKTFNFSEEIKRTATLSGFDEIKAQKQNIPPFQDGKTGREESQISQNRWDHYPDENYLIRGTSGGPLYYRIASILDSLFRDSDILIRTNTIRSLSVFFGIAVVFLSYLTSRKAGYTRKNSLLFMALIAFQPMLSITAAQVNIDIALIFSFSLFLYAGVSFLHSVNGRDSSRSPSALGGLGTTKWAITAIIAAVLGMASKGPGIVLIAALYPLFVWEAYRKYIGNQSMDSRSPLSRGQACGNDNREGENDKKKIFFGYLGIATLVLAGLAFFAIPKSYLTGITNFNANSKFDSPLESIGKYLDKTMSMGEFRDSSLSYWGNFGWLDTPISGWMLSTINWIEIVGFGAVLVYLLLPVLKKKNWIPAFAGMTIRRTGMTDWIATSKTPRNDGEGWVPERKYLIFFLGMILALQFAIRFYDWRIFDTTGRIVIGQPGRYFLPNIVGHLVIVSVGLGLAVSWIRQLVIPYLSRKISWIPAFAGMTEKKTDFEVVMKVLALGMILFQLHAIVNVIVPRYYL